MTLVTDLHMSVLGDNCHTVSTLPGHHGIYSDLKFVCVYRSTSIQYMYLCAYVYEITCESLCNYLVCA